MKLVEIQREKWRKLLPSKDILDLPEYFDDWELIDCFGEDNPGVKFVAIHRFGLFGEKQKTLRQIADIACMKHIERIRQYEAKATRYLRHPYKEYLWPLIRSERLFKNITGYRNIRELILYNHFNYEEYKKLDLTDPF